MNAATPHANPPALEPPSSHDLATVLGSARSLRQAAAAGAPRPLLRGKKLGLLCDADSGADAALFRRAAIELGAHVAHVRPSLSAASSAEEISHTARLLGRLYDAIECEGLPRALVERLAAGAGVPVYDGVASPVHPTARLAAALGDATSTIDNRRFIVQAVLLTTIV